MNVASLLQDSPSDDRERRLQLQMQQRHDHHHHHQIHSSRDLPPFSSSPPHHSLVHTPTTTPPLYPSQRHRAYSPPPRAKMGTPPLGSYGRERDPADRDRERDKEREPWRERELLPAPSPLPFGGEKDGKRRELISAPYQTDDRDRDRTKELRLKERERERERERRERERHGFPQPPIGPPGADTGKPPAGAVIPEHLPATAVQQRRYSPIIPPPESQNAIPLPQPTQRPPTIAIGPPPMENGPIPDYAPQQPPYPLPPNPNHKRRSKRRREHPRSELDPDWETRPDDNTAAAWPQKQKQSPPPQPPFSLGTFIYPRSPFPLGQLPSHMVSSTRAIMFTLCISHRYLHQTFLGYTAREVQIWGGKPNPITNKCIYTDDSELILLPVHTGKVTMEDCIRPKGDLKLVFGVVLRGSRHYPARWDGIQAHGITSFSWGNSHDGHGIELLHTEWIKRNTAHRLYYPNRQARLRDYAERRRALLSLPLNLSFTRHPNPEHPYRVLPDEVDIVSDVWRWHGDGKFDLGHVGCDDGLICGAGLLDSREWKGEETLLFSLDGCLWFKYHPTSLSRVLFPPPPAPPLSDKLISDPSRYLPERERPKKRRKLVNDTDMDLVLEIESESQSAMLLTRPVVEDNSPTDKGRRWDVKLERVSEKDRKQLPAVATAYSSLAESAFQFMEDGVYLWVDATQDALPSPESAKVATKPLLFKAWRWRRRAVANTT